MDLIDRVLRYRKAVSRVSLYVFAVLEWSSLSIYVHAVQIFGLVVIVGCTKWAQLVRENGNWEVYNYVCRLVSFTLLSQL